MTHSTTVFHLSCSIALTFPSISVPDKDTDDEVAANRILDGTGSYTWADTIPESLWQGGQFR